jgi:hypothetical protein
VTTGLHTLRDYYIDIRLCRALRVGDRTDLMKNFAAASVNAIDIRRRIPPEKRNDRHTLRHTNRDPVHQQENVKSNLRRTVCP